MAAAGVTELIEDLAPSILFPDGDEVDVSDIPPQGIMFKLKRLEMCTDGLIGAIRGH